MPKAATGDPEKTPVNFAKLLRTPFLQNNAGWLLLKCGHCKNQAREIDCLCCSMHGCREMNAMLTASAKSQDYEGSILSSRFYGHLPNS